MELNLSEKLPTVEYWMWVTTIPKLVALVVAIVVVHLSQMLRWVLAKTLDWIVARKAVTYK